MSCIAEISCVFVCVGYDESKPKQIGSTIPIKLAACDAAGGNVSSPSVVVHATQLVRVSNLATGDVEGLPADADV